MPYERCFIMSVGTRLTRTVSTTNNSNASAHKDGGTAIGITDASTTSDGSAITNTFNVRDNAVDNKVRSGRIVAISGGTQGTPVGVTGVQTATGSGTLAFNPGVKGHSISNGNGWVIKGWANYLNNTSNTSIYFPASDAGGRVAIHFTEKQFGAGLGTAHRARFWNPVGISGQRGNWSTFPSAANEVYHNIADNDEASPVVTLPSLSVPGELVYLETGKTPTQADYPSKNG